LKTRWKDLGIYFGLYKVIRPRETDGQESNLKNPWRVGRTTFWVHAWIVGWLWSRCPIQSSNEVCVNLRSQNIFQNITTMFFIQNFVKFNNK